MARKLESAVKYCSRCQCNTEHIKNGKQLSVGESLAHLVLVLLTGGFWLIFLFIQLVWNSLSSIGGWTCSKCGKKN